MLNRKLTIALALALAGGAAIAAPGGPGYGPGAGSKADCPNYEARRAEMQQRHEARFKQADADKDGALTKAEVEKALPGVARHFETIDADHDGKVTLAELNAARPGPRGGGGPRGMWREPLPPKP